MPLSEPKFITRAPQPYAAIRLSVPQPDIHLHAPPLIGEIIGWTEQHAEPAGPVFFNYTAMPPGKPMEMEVGAPIAKLVAGDARVAVGTLPGGRYVSVTWTGPYDELQSAHMQLHEWMERHGHTADSAADSAGMTLLEIYHTDPREVEDPKDWVTEIAFKLRD